jgi:formate dehydrogenase major subunit
MPHALPTGRVTITVDGQPREVHAGLTLLQALREEGIHVPHLCYDLRLSRANGNCGLCVVEVEDGARRAKACQTPVQAGMAIRLRTPALDAYRKIRLEQLLSDHNADCEAPCVRTCPAGIDIQGYLNQVGKGNHAAALRLIRARNPFPSACGRVCPHPCEAACRRSLVDEPVAINAVKRFVADRDLLGGQPELPARPAASGRRIAIVGAGPAGLACAWFSALHGHAVTVFERQPMPGGMLRYGIPEYRLPKAVLDREIDLIRRLGVEIQCGKALGTHLRLDDLKRDFDAVFLAVGSWRPTPLGIEGENLPGVWSGIRFLEQVTKGEAPGVGARTVVIGGGNTAIDCARTALRLGARTVQVVYRRTRDEMPAEPAEVAAALAEGVELVALAAPERIADGADGRSLHCIRMTLGEPDRSGRRRPVPVDGSGFAIACDTVIGAIGQATNTQFLYNDLPVRLNKWGDVEIGARTFATSEPGIFAGGDCVTGPATVVQAVAAGRKAADALHGWVVAGVVPEAGEDYSCSRGSLEDLDRAPFMALPRQARGHVPELPPDQRRDFREVDGALDEDAARAEAARCLKCGCLDRSSCALRREATAHGVVHRPPLHRRPDLPVVADHPIIRRDSNKCIACGRCITACSELEGVGVLAYRLEQGRMLVGTTDGKPLAETGCVACGQCVNACPCGALSYERDRGRVFRAINEPGRTVVGFLAPAVRAHLAARFGIPAARIHGFMAGLLRRLGFDQVFDFSFAADLTIMEEGTELLGRVQAAGRLPLITSCCPGWVSHAEQAWPDLLPHLSSCKSPQQMMGTTVKHHFAERAGIARDRLFVVSIVPCVAKKSEAARPEFSHDGVREVDAVLTTTELIEMVELAQLDPATIADAEFDPPYRTVSGAGVLFGNSGGVTEAAVRMAVEVLDGRPPAAIPELVAVRGFAGVRAAEVEAGGTTLRVAVASGLANAKPLLDQIRAGSSPYHLIEIMACPGGCICGAGHPVPTSVGMLPDRHRLLVDLDRTAVCRTSQANLDVARLYRDYYGEPGGHRAHELLHTAYRPRG